MITVEELIDNNDNYLIIDLRSPIEYERGFIRNAINIPLLNNEMREVVGILYNEDKAAAYREGYKVGLKTLPLIYNEVLELTKKYPNKQVIFYCFRGGMRSSSVNQLINQMNIKALKLDGGYKGYRRYLIDKLDEYITSVNWLVLAGHTGSGKTIVLNQLKDDDYPVIDLEGIAKHRGSIFGKMGIKTEINQRNFEDELFYQLKYYIDKNKSNIFVEAESRKIGDLFLPNMMNDQLKTSEHILIDVSVKKRTEIILSTYAEEKIDDMFIIKLLNNNHYFKLRLGNEWVNKMIGLIETQKYNEFVSIILTDYYDKLYDFTQEKYSYKLSIKNDDLDLIVGELKNYYGGLNE